MAGHSEDISKHVRVYILVFVALMILTVATVAVSTLHLSIGAAVVVAMAIATVKGSLVACYFMHLISEKSIIYWVLALTVFFFGMLMLIPTLEMGDSAGTVLHH